MGGPNSATAPLVGLGTSRNRWPSRCVNKRSARIVTRAPRRSVDQPQGLPNVLRMRPSTPAGTDQRGRCFAECDFGINLDQLLAAGHLRRQHLIRHATDDVLNAAQKLNGEQDFYR